MKTTFELSENLQNALARPTRGVIGLVDDLMRLCPKQGVRLDWHADCCRIRSLADNPHESLDLPLRKSVFRAVLARVAALCNERSPSSVSPYGGQGEMLTSADPSTIFKVAFTNTTEEQKLELAPRPACSALNHEQP